MKSTTDTKRRFAGPGRPKLKDRSPDPTNAELELVRELNRGRSMTEVAKAYGLSWSTVRTINNKVTDHIRREYLGDIVRMKVEHSEKLSDLYRESRKAWEDSQKPTMKTQTKPGKVPDGATLEECLDLPEEVTVTETTTSGDPRFLAESRTALADIRKIWGADAPLRVELAGELRVAGKSQEEADAELVKHVQSLLKQMKN